MSFQWTCVAGFLYVEIFVLIVLLTPFISAYRWKKIFYSRLVGGLANYSSFAFRMIMVILFVLFIDAFREMQKFNAVDAKASELNRNPQADALVHMRLFRAQRNLFVAGFALFICLVLKRLLSMICAQATLEAQHEASVRQGISASETAQRLMQERDDATDNDQDAAEDAKQEKQLAITRDELKRAKEELQHSNLDLAALQKKAADTGRLYDELLDEHAVLKKRVLRLKAEAGQ